MGIALLFFVVIVIALTAIAVDHRRRAKENDDPTGSLWWHLQREWFETQERNRKKKRLREDARIERNNARHEAMAALDQKLQAHANSVSETIGGKRSRRERRKLARKGGSSVRPATGELKEQFSPSVKTDLPENRDFKALAPPLIGALGAIRFFYESDGGRSKREVDVLSIDTNYLKGYCHLRRGIRTFRLDRIAGNITCLDTGEVMTLRSWKQHARKLVTDRPVGLEASKQIDTGYQGTGYVAVYLAGFRENHRRQLEQKVRSAGHQIRDAIDSSVDLLVAGPLAGERQLQQAEKFHVEIVDEAELTKRICR